MRPLQVHVRTSELGRVLAAAGKHGSTRPVTVPADRLRTDGEPLDDRWSLVLLHLPNENVGAFVEDVRHDLQDPQFILLPIGALPLETPMSELDARVRDVSRLSTLELVIASLQSIGAWRGMLMFSVLAGIIGAYGLIFDIGYVLVAAMLVNPMGAPALVSVIGIAVGDMRMFGRGALRFCVSLAVQASAALVLGFAYGLSVSTAMMEQVTSLSAWAALIALAAGIAGAQAQASSERDSLVSGTATGFMVAAALAPPAAVLGLAVPLGRWDYFGLMAFLLMLQYLAIVAGGWIGLALLGVRPAQPSVGRGDARTRSLLLAGIILATIGFVFWQTRLEPRFTQSDLSRIGLEIARDATADRGDVLLVSSSAAFTRRDIAAYDGETMLMQVIVERGAGAAPDDSIAAQLRRRVRALVAQRMKDVVPFVNVTVLPGPEPQNMRAP
jgi:uncharacterized membrane protein